jgi:Zn-dependent protease
MSLEREQAWGQAKETWQQMLAWLPGETEQTKAVQARVEAIDARARASEDNKAKWTKRLGPFAPVLLFLGKIKTLLFVLLKFKFLLSFVGFFAVYWALFGWKFGLGFTVSILLHEMGHYVAARSKGLKVDLPVFLPGLGAYVKWYSQGVTLDTLSSIALAGPFAGLLVAAACGAVYYETKMELWGALAYTGAWLNLINLVPVLGLDGAQAAIALNRVQRGLILVSCIVFYAWLREGVFLFIAAGAAWKTFTGYAPEKPSSSTMVRYMLLLFALGMLMSVVPDSMRRF